MTPDYTGVHTLLYAGIGPTDQSTSKYGTSTDDISSTDDIRLFYGVEGQVCDEPSEQNLRALIFFSSPYSSMDLKE
jgi:hypothetical protein